MKIDTWFSNRRDFYSQIFLFEMTDIYVCSLFLEWPLNPMKNTMARHIFSAQLNESL
jgi:hypothetical protein